MPKDSALRHVRRHAGLVGALQGIAVELLFEQLPQQAVADAAAAEQDAIDTPAAMAGSAAPPP